jgi:hypothetical protein
VSKLLTTAVLAVVLVGLVAGCGGGDETTDATTDETVTLTKAEFIKQGDAICKSAGEQSEKKAEEFAEENGFKLEGASEEQLEEAIAEVLVSTLRKQAEGLDALGAPEGDEEQVEAIIVSLEGATDEVEDDPSVVFEEKVFDKPNELAQDYGFKVCGE